MKPTLTTKAAIGILALVQVVCPLLFFTNLTRNPYYTQIALLNIGIVLCAILWSVETWRRGEWRLPRLSFEAPLAAFLVVALVSTTYSWFRHTDLRPGIAYEGVRVWVFTLVNSVMVIYLPILFTRPISASTKAISIWADIFLASFWGLAWVGFQSMKDPDPHQAIWDTYGAFLWILAGVYALRRVKDGEAVEFFHLIFATGLVAGIYGILQYWGRDLIWSSLIQPYGGRPVSTFGNPNFLSSYLLLVAPLALAFSFYAKGKDVWGYLLVALVAVVSLLCTLTRSTYVGLLASGVFMIAALYRPENRVWIKRIAVAAAVFIGLILLFPRTPISIVQSPLARFTEIFSAMESGTPYGPWHQRILIWSSAWDMARESHLLGKGWGAFELFYPFYQGAYLTTRLFEQFRTHANNAHNILLELWSQTGFLGVGTAIWLFAALVFGGLVIVKRKSPGLPQAVAAALLAGFSGMVVDNFFGNVSIFFAVPAFLFWWNAGALYNEGLPAKEQGLGFYTGKIGLAGRSFLLGVIGFSVAVTIYYVKRWEQETYYFDGFRESKVGDVSRSYKALEQAYAWFAGEVNSNYELGNSYSRHAKELGDKGLREEAKRYWEKAEWAFEAAVRANPGYDEIYFNLGITQMQLGKKEEGLRNLRLSLFINPLLRDAYGSLGNTYVADGQPEKAAAVFEQAVDVFPNDKDFLNNLGVSYSRMHQPEKSFAIYKKAVQVDPNFTQGWQNLMAAAHELHRTDPILEVPSLVARMQALVNERNYVEANKAATRIVELMPDNADAHLSRANVLFYLGRRDEALKSYERALEIRPGFLAAFVNMGKVYQSGGQKDLAMGCFKKALEIDPKDNEARQGLQQLQ